MAAAEVLECAGDVLPDRFLPDADRRSRSSASASISAERAEMSESDERQRRLTSATLDILRRWASRVHPEDIDLTIEALTNGTPLLELLSSFQSEAFDEELIEKFSYDNDKSKNGAIRRIEKIRQQLQNFYSAKAHKSLNNTPSYFVPASDIVAADEDSLMRFLIIIYGVAVFLKHRATNTFQDLLKEQPEDVQSFTNDKIAEFVELLSGTQPPNYEHENRELRQKLSEFTAKNANLDDKVSDLTRDLTAARDELTRTAEASVIKQELEIKVQDMDQLKDRHKLADEQCHKLEAELTKIAALKESLASENIKLKRQLGEAQEESRENKDEKVSLEHQLSITKNGYVEMEQKYNRLNESVTQKPSEREHTALKERYAQQIKKITELEERVQTNESVKITLSSRDEHIKQMRQEKESMASDLYTLQNENRDLRSHIKELEARRATTTPADIPTSPASLAEEFLNIASFPNEASNDELVKLKVENDNLRSENRALEEELARTKTYVETETEKTSATLTQMRIANEALALKAETAQAEFTRARVELERVGDRRRLADDEAAATRAHVDELEAAVRRAGYLLAEYVHQHEDGSSTGVSGAECLQLRVEMARLTETLAAQRIAADAYRHIAAEEQRLITAEWYDASVRHLQQRFVVSMSSSGGTSDSVDSAIASDYLAGSGGGGSSTAAATPHLHAMQANVLAVASARSTPTLPDAHSPAAAAAYASALHGGGAAGAMASPPVSSVDTRASTPNSSLDYSGFVRRFTPSFLRQQHDTPQSSRAGAADR